MNNVIAFPRKQGIHMYTPEVDVIKPNCQLTYSIGHNGDNFVKGKLELKGRGIKLIKLYEDGTYFYRVTDLALKKLETAYSLVYTRYLD